MRLMISTSVLALLFALGFGVFSFTQTALAADTVVSSVYQDSDNNGTIDRVRITMDETITACAYEASDWSVGVAGNMTMSITGLSCTGSDAIMYVAVNADANETGSSVNPELVYSNGGTLGSVTLTSGAKSATGPIVTTDAALPVLRLVTYQTTGCGAGNSNSIQLNYTEDLQLSANSGSSFATSGTLLSSATLSAMTTARTLEGLGSWAALNGGDMTVSGATANTVNINSGGNIIICFNYAVGSYFSSGTAGPTTAVFTPISDVTALKDLAGLALNVAAASPTLSGSGWDVTKPTIVNTYSCDTDADGDIDRIQINTSESVLDTSLSVTYLEGDNDVTNNGAGEEVPATINTSTAGCDGNAADTDANDDKFRIDFTTGISGTDVAYLSFVTGSVIRDSHGNAIAVGSALGTEADKASPRLLSSSPAQGGSINRTSAITLTFSESVTSVTAAVSPTATLVASGAPGSTITFTPTTLSRGTNTFTISAAPDASGNLYGGATGAVNPFTFNVTGGSSSTTTETPVTYTLAITAPAGGESFAYGNTTTLTWTFEGSAMSYVSLYYSTDGGTTYETIAEDEPNNGTYVWTVPDITSESVTLYVTGTDLATVLATDVSEEFTVVGTTTSTDATTETPTTETTTEEVSAPTSGETGTSPVTGLEEDISIVYEGNYIKSPSFTTVYYIDDELQRHPFIDAQTFFTFEDDFSNIVTVTDATLSTLTIADPMLPNPGVTLVKIQSDDNVYAVDASEGLRWITTEEIAIAMYGQSWSDYVIDLPPTLFPHFTVGSAIESAETIDVSSMKNRFALSIENPNDDTDGDDITNAEEVQLGTSLDDADTDDDGYPDALEVGSGHDPLTALDSDGDGYPNYIEILHGYDPYVAA